MSDYQSNLYNQYHQTQKKRDSKNKLLLHLGLFLITFITTTLAGVAWTTNVAGPYDIEFLVYGLPYSFAILFVITCHEFGHYFAAKYHKVDATLPYYIPFPYIPGFLNFGTMGAVIRTKSPVYSNKTMFDIGVAGPIAGFIACLVVLIYGFMNVPGEEYILAIHPDYFSPEYGAGTVSIAFGDTLLFSFMRMIFVQPGEFFPPMSEIYHYPFLCVGWFGLFVTAMNMIPVGQLDGGHITYTMFGGKKAYKIALYAFAAILVIGIIGTLEAFLIIPTALGWSGWLFWALILFFLIKLKHPPIPDESPLDKKRRVLGYIAYLIFIVSFSPTPFIISTGGI
jgi:membrane-associated protease RseP (regulator of RpoE activity)